MPRPPKAETSITVPISLRVTQRMLKRLQRLSTTDGLAQQEHVRRALDIYLNGMEKSLTLAPLPTEETPPDAS